MLQFIKLLVTLQRVIYYDFLGGPKICQMRLIINIFKGATFFYVIFLMQYYQNFSTGIYIYLALHGSYGIVWLFKDYVYGDKTFVGRITIGSSMLLTILLCLYWLMPWFIASRLGIQQPSYERIKTCIFLYILGVTLMIAADAQKNFTLKYKKGLINDGVFSRVRNPNYLGQMMLYGSFAILSGYWISYIILGFIWSTLFLSNFLIKDFVSLRKKQGWKQYQENSYIILPRIFSSHILNILTYGIGVGLIYMKYNNMKFGQVWRLLEMYLK